MRHKTTVRVKGVIGGRKRVRERDKNNKNPKPMPNPDPKATAIIGSRKAHVCMATNAHSRTMKPRKEKVKVRVKMVEKAKVNPKTTGTTTSIRDPGGRPRLQ